jgi:hypothetical protein
MSERWVAAVTELNGKWSNSDFKNPLLVYRYLFFPLCASLTDYTSTIVVHNFYRRAVFLKA